MIQLVFLSQIFFWLFTLKIPKGPDLYYTSMKFQNFQPPTSKSDYVYTAAADPQPKLGYGIYPRIFFRHEILLRSYLLENRPFHTHNLFRVQLLNNQIFKIDFVRKSSRIKFCYGKFFTGHAPPKKKHFICFPSASRFFFRS